MDSVTHETLRLCIRAPIPEIFEAYYLLSAAADAVQAAASIRNTVKTCVEEAAKLAAAGCP